MKRLLKAVATVVKVCVITVATYIAFVSILCLITPLDEFIPKNYIGN